MPSTKVSVTVWEEQRCLTKRFMKETARRAEKWAI